MCVLRKDAHIDIDGETVHVDVSADSPAYLVIHDNGKRVLLSHRDVMLKHVNVYT